jgi:predicted outer membrane protein
MPEAKGATATTQRSSTDETDSDDEAVHKDAQAGVQRIEAATQVWSKSTLIAVYGL